MAFCKSTLFCFMLVGGMLLCSTLAAGEVGFKNCTKHFPSTITRPYQIPNAIELCREGTLAISYDPETQNPQWAAYYVTGQELHHTISGRDDFYLDPDLKELKIPQPSPSSDAFNTTWNRGHLAPNHIMSYSEAGKYSCFTMANVAPQYYYWNQHEWVALESAIYDWAYEHKALYIMTGVAYKDRSDPHFTYDKIGVPDYFWTVLCDPETTQAVGFYGGNWPFSEVVSYLGANLHKQKMSGSSRTAWVKFVSRDKFQLYAHYQSWNSGDQVGPENNDKCTFYGTYFQIGAADDSYEAFNLTVSRVDSNCYSAEMQATVGKDYTCHVKDQVLTGFDPATLVCGLNEVEVQKR